MTIKTPEAPRVEAGDSGAYIHRPDSYMLTSKWVRKKREMVVVLVRQGQSPEAEIRKIYEGI